MKGKQKAKRWTMKKEVKKRTKTRIGREGEVAEAEVARGKRDAGALQNILPARTPRMPPDNHTVADLGPAPRRTATKIETEKKKERGSEKGTMKETGKGTGGETTGKESETETPEEEMDEGEIGMRITGGQAAEREAVQRGAEEAVTGETERKK